MCYMVQMSKNGPKCDKIIKRKILAIFTKIRYLYIAWEKSVFMSFWGHYYEVIILIWLAWARLLRSINYKAFLNYI